jgi:LMBR1 domain-containing protein 1
MADIFLIVVVAVAVVLLLISAIYLVVYYSHPDDKNDAYFPKLVVILGFVISGATVLGLPLDVANNEGYAGTWILYWDLQNIKTNDTLKSYTSLLTSLLLLSTGCDGFDTAFCGGLNMQLFWDIFFWLIPIWTFVMIPFNTFYYEADDGYSLAAMAGVAAPARSRSRFAQALCGLIVVLVIVALIFLLTYLFLSDTNIPVREYVSATPLEANASGVVWSTQPRYNGTADGELLPFAINQFEPIQNIETKCCDTNLSSTVQENPDDIILTLQVSVSTFYAGLMAWIGWFFFAVFGGIGLSALPMDFILSFVNRPKHMNPEEFAEAKESIQKRVNEMVEIGEQLKREREEREKMGDAARKSWFSAEARKDARTERNTMREFKAAVYILEQDVADFTAASSASEKYNPLLPWLSLFAGIICTIISILWIVQIAVYLLPPTPLIPFLNTYFQWFDSWFPLFGTLSVAIFTTYLLFCAVKGCFKFGLRFMCIS